MNFHQAKIGMILGLILVVVPVLTYVSEVQGCTIAVVSGKVTEDGRPLLWKNRDTDSRRNLVQVFTEGKYRLMAVIDAGHPETIWMGMNDRGLCIVNSLSLDLPGGNRVGRGNGRFMKLALENCANALEFEKLLVETNQSGRRTRANFGVIDSQGAAALFEVGHRKFVKFDANDAETHPDGFVVRSNFSMTATGEKHPEKSEELLKVYSGRRYLRANGMVESYLKRTGRLDYRFFLQNLSRDVSDAIDGPMCCYGENPADEDTSAGRSLFATPRIDTRSTINRRNTVSAVVFHGVKPGNTPRWTTMWTLLGEPAFSVAVPCWMTNSHLPEILQDPEHNSLCEAAWQVRELNYESPNVLSTRWLGCIWAETRPLEDRIILETKTRIETWRKQDRLPNPDEINRFQEDLAESALKSLLKLKSRIDNEPAMAEKPNGSRFVAANSTIDDPTITGE